MPLFSGQCSWPLRCHYPVGSGWGAYTMGEAIKSTQTNRADNSAHSTSPLCGQLGPKDKYWHIRLFPHLFSHDCWGNLMGQNSTFLITDSRLIETNKVKALSTMGWADPLCRTANRIRGTPSSICSHQTPLNIFHIWRVCIMVVFLPLNQMETSKQRLSIAPKPVSQQTKCRDEKRYMPSPCN